VSSISVVIPTCNDRPEFLEAALRCVEEQTLPAGEVIVVDNGAVPPTLDRHVNVAYVQIPRFAGPAQARNFGASLATGEYVAFLDDDDLWENQYLEKVAAVIHEEQPDCLITRLDKLIDGEVVEYKCADGHLTLDELFVRNPGASGSSTVVRRRTFLEVSGYDPKLTTGQDKGLVISLLLNGSKVCAAPRIQAILRHHDGPRMRDRRFQGVMDLVRNYGQHMTAQQRHHNLAKAHRLRFRAQRNRLDPLRARYHETLCRLAGLLGR
jgi:glycosyltransferase involved in cell wall biosynthesis